MDTDTTLLQRCLAGNGQARNEFVARFAPVILGAVRRVLGRGPSDPSLDTEDVAQDVFLKFFRDDARLLRRFDPARASLGTWLSIVARTTALDIVRKKRPLCVPLEEERHATRQDASDGGPDLPHIPADLLSARQKLVMHLLFDRDLSVPDVARIMKVSEQTVRSTKHKAILKLRPFFEKRMARTD